MSSLDVDFDALVCDNLISPPISPAPLPGDATHRLLGRLPVADARSCGASGLSPRPPGSGSIVIVSRRNTTIRSFRRIGDPALTAAYPNCHWLWAASSGRMDTEEASARPAERCVGLGPTRRLVRFNRGRSGGSRHRLASSRRSRVSAICSLRKRTAPSAIKNSAPPGWRLQCVVVVRRTNGQARGLAGSAARAPAKGKPRGEARDHRHRRPRDRAGPGSSRQVVAPFADHQRMGVPSRMSRRPTGRLRRKSPSPRSRSGMPIMSPRPNEPT